MSDNGLASRIIRVIERVAGGILAIVAIMIVASAIGRYGFSTPMPDAFDLPRLVLGVAIIWGLASAGYHGSHIKVDLLAQAFRGPLRRAVNAFAWSVLLLFLGLLIWKIFDRVMSAHAGGDATMDLRLPHWPFFAAIWLGLIAGFFASAWRLYLVVFHGRELEELDDHEAAEDQGVTKE